MEEELSYVTVAFKTNRVSTYEKPTDMEIIYDEVKSVEEEQRLDKHLVETENTKTAPLCTALTWTVAALGIICVVLASIILVLVHLTNEQRRENVKLTEQRLQLWTERAALERQTEELSRDRDRLNWTMGVILEYDSFPVQTFCPDKVCRPCPDDWVPFQSSCYLFSQSVYYSEWKNWKQSRDHCRQQNADLVVIDNKEEQEFINNHTEAYDDKNHGYWIGLSKDTTGTWLWVDGSNFTVTYWIPQQTDFVSCALSQPRADPLANWHKTSCNMRNRWICETRALIKPD